MSLASMHTAVAAVNTSLAATKVKVLANPNVVSPQKVLDQVTALANVVDDLITYAGNLNDSVTALTARVTTLEGEV